MGSGDTGIAKCGAGAMTVGCNGHGWQGHTLLATLGALGIMSMSGQAAWVCGKPDRNTDPVKDEAGCVVSEPISQPNDEGKTASELRATPRDAQMHESSISFCATATSL